MEEEKRGKMNVMLFLLPLPQPPPPPPLGTTDNWNGLGMAAIVSSSGSSGQLCCFCVAPPQLADGQAAFFRRQAARKNLKCTATRKLKQQPPPKSRAKSNFIQTHTHTRRMSAIHWASSLCRLDTLEFVAAANERTKMRQ